MLISVTMPIYNGNPFLHEAIASILAQDEEFELIVSDDGSSDGSLETVESFADPRIRILRNQSNAGIFGNLNRCIAAARGSLIQVFSQDDVMMPGYIASQSALLSKYSDAGLVYGSMAVIDADGKKLGENNSDVTPERIDWPLYLWISSHYGALPASISSIMVPRQTFDIVGLFDPSYPVAGDLEFYNRVAERFSILRDKNILHSVRRHTRMTSALPSSGKKYLEEEVRLENWFRKHWSEEEWAKVKYFRAAVRGRYHLGWISRLALSGRPDKAMRELNTLNKIYPLNSVIYSQLRNVINRDIHLFPEIAAPQQN